MKEYKVVSLKKRSFLKGALDASGLQEVLNRHASEGWTYHHAIQGETEVFEKDAFLLIFCREK